MNKLDRLELERLKRWQARLEDDLKQLGEEIKTFERRALETPVDEAATTLPPTPATQPIRVQIPPSAKAPAQPQPISVPLPPPPVIPPAASQAEKPPAPVPPTPAPQPQPLHLHKEHPGAQFVTGNCVVCHAELDFVSSAVGGTIICPHCGASTLLSVGAGAIPVPPPIPPRIDAGPSPAPAAPSPARIETAPPVATGQGSLELRFGTHWAPRIGIVLVLTSLVFFGNYAYQNYIGKLGAGGKITLMYIGSALLLGAGAWWQRRAAKAELKNYAEVLFAGGQAAVYFTTYAAHHIDVVRVIQSPSLDGVLLFLWAAFMVWMAERKKSELLAFFGVGLAYYTSIITRVGAFTLYSNLLLTVAAVFFLVRNRWAVLSFASLVASYAAYAFWRFLDNTGWHWPEGELWPGVYFLMAYWVVFTGGVFLTRDERFAGQNRATFLSMNNIAFFTLFVLTMIQVRTGNFYIFSCSYGAVLLALSLVAGRTLPAEPMTRNFYLTQGLLLVTLGIITKFSGMQLSLMLAAESVVLLLLGQARQSRVLLVGGYVAAALAVGWGIDGMRLADRAGLYKGIGLGLFMLANVVLAHRQAGASERPLRPGPAYFTVLMLVAWFAATWDNAARESFPLWLAAEGLALTMLVYALRVPEIPLLAQADVALAQLVWAVNALDRGQPPEWWKPALLVGISLGLSHWWQRQKVLQLAGEVRKGWQWLYALAIVALLYLWLEHKVEAPVWIALTAGLAVGLTAYGRVTRLWLLAAAGQVFLVVSVVQFAMQLSSTHPPAHLSVMPILALPFLAIATDQWFRLRPDAPQGLREPLLQIAIGYRWVALAMSIWWICTYAPARERIWLLSLLGLWFFLWAGWQRKREALLISAAYTLSALVLFWLPLLEAPTVYWPNLAAIIILLAQRQFARRLPERYPLDQPVHGTVIVIGGLSLWLFLSRWVMESFSGFFLTASWSALGLVLFTAGIALRERVYRWLGLVVLACALGRIVIFDVWKLESLYRILSFFALGLVLLVLGFVYSKYQEKIREWL